MFASRDLVLKGVGRTNVPLKLVESVCALAEDSGSSSNIVSEKLEPSKAEEDELKFGETGYKCRASGGGRAEYGGIGASD